MFVAIASVLGLFRASSWRTRCLPEESGEPWRDALAHRLGHAHQPTDGHGERGMVARQHHRGMDRYTMRWPDIRSCSPSASSSFSSIMRFVSAVSIRVSHFHGQHDYTAIRRKARAGRHLNFKIAILVSVPVILFRRKMCFLFPCSPKVAAEVASAIVPLIIYQFSDGLQCTFSNAMRGLAYVKPVMLVAFLSYFVVSLPLAYFGGISLQEAWRACSSPSPSASPLRAHSTITTITAVCSPWKRLRGGQHPLKTA